MNSWELPEYAVKRLASWPARNEQANVHVYSSRGGSVEFVLCAIDTHLVCFQSGYQKR